MPFATIDLSAATSAISDVTTALTGQASTIITAGLGVAALFYGGLILWRAAKRFMK